jgi:hypothetical protein
MSGASWQNVSQITPSMSCWIPNRSGIIAKGSSVLALVLLIAATPITDSDVPAMKLAEAEKHIGRHPFVAVRRELNLLDARKIVRHSARSSDPRMRLTVTRVFWFIGAPFRIPVQV